MKRLILNILILFIVIFIRSGFAQDHQNLQGELDRLRISIQKTAALINMLPNSDLKSRITIDLQKAESEYQTARTLVEQHKILLARVHIKAAYQFLLNIERIIKNHPAFKIKFRERLDLKIQQAEDAVSASQRNEAIFMLNRAKFFRQKAYMSFHENRPYAALEYYRLAIFFAEKAIQLSFTGRDLPVKDWRAFYTETQTLLERARNSAENSQNYQVIAMVQKAGKDLDEIERLYANGHKEQAKEKLRVLNRSLYRFIDLAENVPQRDVERLQIDLETLKLSLQSLEEDLSNVDSPAARQLFLRVSNLVRNIEMHINRNQPRMARQKMRLANRLIMRIYRLLQSQASSEPRQLEQQLSLAQQNYSELQHLAAENADSDDLIRLIDSNLRKAENAFRAENYLQAAYYLKIANVLILQVNRLSLRESSLGLKREKVRTDLKRLEDLLVRLEGGSMESNEMRIRYENAKKLYKIASKAFKDNQYYKCQELTKMAINLITK